MIQGSGEKVSVPSRLRMVWEPFLNRGQDRGFGVIHDAVEAHAGGQRAWRHPVQCAEGFSRWRS